MSNFLPGPLPFYFCAMISRWMAAVLVRDGVDPLPLPQLTLELLLCP